MKPLKILGGAIAAVKSWLYASPTAARPPDLDDFRASQKRLYDQAASVDVRTDELLRMSERLKATTRTLQSKVKVE